MRAKLGVTIPRIKTVKRSTKLDIAGSVKLGYGQTLGFTYKSIGRTMKKARKLRIESDTLQRLRLFAVRWKRLLAVLDTYSLRKR